ncbi:MAG: tetratricopeptide repeat protein [Alphaproteobacteria bacterium]|jgi:tetratricopeptide (TPR) repeat protein|nr:tetratricopeptide repeat protein [Alphaproteobacteria bacterium]MDP7123062.1 tetratricopeptide repeat protein [Alphaproteobacteria bacterium]MEE1568642.1 tetratricopeptide repeat protein [Alphaproteobacteria bacterium]|tara:strand:+ start:1256 stop:2110 length:855 start_codon:yes stop_codon:yes gene_type:complete
MWRRNSVIFSFLATTVLCAASLCVLSLVARAGETPAKPAPPTGNVTAEDEAELQRYSKCAGLARKNPRQAFDHAMVWVEEDKKNMTARHCLAISLIAIQDYFTAGEQLERIIADMELGGRGLPPDVAVELYRQTGQAWMLAAENERAVTMFTAALAIIPDHVDSLIDRGIVKAEAHRYWEALEDLDRALELAPDRIEAYILRANAYRELNSMEMAAKDVDTALNMSPDNPDALFERAVIRYSENDLSGARADWRRITELIPGTPLAHSAQVNLDRMDAVLQEGK